MADRIGGVLGDDGSIVVLPARVHVTPRTRGDILEQRVEALELQGAELVRHEQERQAQAAEQVDE